MVRNCGLDQAIHMTSIRQKKKEKKRNEALSLSFSTLKHYLKKRSTIMIDYGLFHAREVSHSA